MTVAELVVQIGDGEVARLRRGRTGRVSLTYVEAWRATPGAFPLSLSMPLALAEHGPSVVDPFLWGLLPDNELILSRWGERFQVSPRNAFGLLAHVGEDCAGAVRIVAPERLGADDDAVALRVEWLDDAAVAERLRLLRRDAAAWRTTGDLGQFSLAGAQPKTALLLLDRRWGIPSGRTATTHILKPGIAGLDAQAENEHFCLTLGRALGLPVAHSFIHRFDDEPAIVVERYDRVVHGGRVLRVHQEDVCQALAVHPARKYEAEGGPGARAIAGVLREHSRRPDEDVETLVDALALNWLVGGTDAHAKNYSLLIGAEGRTRLAPLYDVASALPYPHLQQRKLKLAMKIGGKYRLWEIGRHEWSKLAGEVGKEPDAVVARVRAMAERTPDLAADVGRRLVGEGLDAVATRRVEAAIREWATRCAGRLAGE
jgi:serine/threonine-protein kinase HipA